MAELRDQLATAQAKNVALSEELRQLQLITQPVKVFGCHYPTQIMALAIFIVLNGGSLRCAAATVGFYAELMNWPFKAPTWRTIPNWVQRCGLYSLNDTEKLTGDFRLLIDASIQMGKEQVMLLLGVKAEAPAGEVCRNTPLTMADTVVLGVEVQSSWTGTEVAAFIERNLKVRPGVRVLHFVNDQGTNLLAALRQLGHPWVSDCTHVILNLVKDIFEHDPSLERP